MLWFVPFDYPAVSNLEPPEMLVKHLLVSHGNFLFRWRSYLPLLLFPALVAAGPESVRIEQALGNTLSAIWTGICIAVALLGVAIRVAVVGVVPAGTSGRNVD